MGIRGRLLFTAVLITLGGLIILGRLFFLQVISADYYRSLAERQQIALRDLKPRRGDIFLFDKTGHKVTAATTRSGFLLYVDSRKITDPEKTLIDTNRLLTEVSNGILHVEHDAFFKSIEKRDDPFEILIPKIESEIGKKIEDAKIAGIGVLPIEWRFYPLTTIAANTIGFYGFGKGNSEAGQYGIERFYEDELRGNSGIEESASPGAAFLNIGKNIFNPPAEGSDIALTIEFEIQEHLEKKLDDIMKEWSPQRAGGIIIDPKTGRILAMAVRPAFDPNIYSETKDLSYFLNPIVSSIYELGSIFKPLTIAAALDAKAITPKDTYYDHGFVQIGPARIENFDGKGRGKVDVQEILNQSLNTGAVFVQQKLGKDRFLEYFKNYGLNEKTGIDLPAEVSGNMSNLGSGREVEYASASFGQGIAVTPIEFVRAASALANGGLLVDPYVVESVEKSGFSDTFFKRREKEARVVRRVLSEETSRTISAMLSIVVDKALLGGGKGPEHYSVAAKTGTAQMLNKNSSGYSEEYLHTFFGYAPAFEAKFLVFLFAERPQGVQYASHSLGPAFFDLINRLLYYYEIPPDR